MRLRRGEHYRRTSVAVTDNETGTGQGFFLPVDATSPPCKCRSFIRLPFCGAAAQLFSLLFYCIQKVMTKKALSHCPGHGQKGHRFPQKVLYKYAAESLSNCVVACFKT